MTPDEEQAIIDSLTEVFISLHRRIDEASTNQMALIMTLKELVPGFAERFDRLRIGMEKPFAENDPEFVLKLRKSMKLSVH